jgi:hypothetical protein
MFKLTDFEKKEEACASSLPHTALLVLSILQGFPNLLANP